MCIRDRSHISGSEMIYCSRINVLEQPCCDEIEATSKDNSKRSYLGLYRKQDFSNDGRAVFRYNSTFLYWRSSSNNWLVSHESPFIGVVSLPLNSLSWIFTICQIISFSLDLPLDRYPYMVTMPLVIEYVPVDVILDGHSVAVPASL